MPYKRAVINGTSPLDMKGMNDNFSAIFLKLFGDINMSDIQNDFKAMLYTNWLQPQGEGNLDSNSPLTVRFYVPDNTKEIRKAEFNFILSHYRMDSDIAKSNTDDVSFSGITTEENLGLTTYDTGETFYYGVKDATVVNGSNLGSYEIYTSYTQTNAQGDYHKIQAETLDHAHDITHTHTFSSTAKLPSHVHVLNKGIIEDTGSLPVVDVFVNAVEIPITLNNSVIKANKIDIKEHLIIGDWNTVEIKCDPISETEKSIARVTAFGIIELLQKYI